MIPITVQQVISGARRELAVRQEWAAAQVRARFGPREEVVLETTNARWGFSLMFAGSLVKDDE